MGKPVMKAFTAIRVLAALLAGINGCEMPSGSLPCNSREQLTPGSSFTISSKVCNNGLYPKREKCGWYFDVSGCKPTLSCEEMDVKGRQRKCKGDKLRVKTKNTAAHCLIGETTNSFNVVVGEHNLTVEDGEETFSVCNMKIHPEYNSDTNDHDVAILTLCNSLTFRKEVSPVCLPPQTGDAYDDVEATVTGWGTLFAGGPSPDVLNGVNVRTIGNAELVETMVVESSRTV